MIAREVVEKTAPRGQQARQRFTAKPTPVQLGYETADLMNVQIGERDGSRQFEQGSHVVRISVGGVPRQAPLLPQLRQETGEVGMIGPGSRGRGRGD